MNRELDLGGDADADSSKPASRSSGVARNEPGKAVVSKNDRAAIAGNRLGSQKREARGKE